MHPAIGRDLALPRQVIQRVIDGLKERGLVDAAPNPAHRRSSIQRLTPKGAALIKRLLARDAKDLRTLAAPLTTADITTWHRKSTYYRPPTLNNVIHLYKSDASYQNNREYILGHKNN